MKPPIKQNLGRAICILVLSAFASFAQAASFDCAKTQSKVEHLICDNPEMSKLDEEMAASYKGALQDQTQAEAIKPAQKQCMLIALHHRYCFAPVL